MYVDVEVFYDDVEEKWMVHVGGQHSTGHRLKQRAEKKGREKAKMEQDQSQLTVYNMQGNISYRQFYE